MKKNTLFLFLLVLFLLLPDLSAQESRKYTPIENEQAAVTLIIIGNDVRVQNASIGSVLEVYNILGVKLYSVRIDSTDKTITLNLPKGCYVLKIEQTVRKVVIK